MAAIGSSSSPGVALKISLTREDDNSINLHVCKEILEEYLRPLQRSVNSVALALQISVKKVF